MLKRRSFWIYILLSFFILASALNFRAFVSFYFISPLAQFFWAIYRLFASVHQKVYWFLLAGLIVFLAYRIIFFASKEPEARDTDGLDKPTRREQFWVKTISNAINNEGDAREFLRRQLGKLFLSASNLNVRTEMEGVEKVLLNMQPPLPINLLSLINPSDGEHAKHAEDVNFGFVRHIIQLLWWRKKQMREAIYKDIAETIHSMEDYLEIDHENEPSR